jgi:hypothetical protein
MNFSKNNWTFSMAKSPQNISSTRGLNNIEDRWCLLHHQFILGNHRSNLKNKHMATCEHWTLITSKVDVQLPCTIGWASQ